MLLLLLLNIINFSKKFTKYFANNYFLQTPIRTLINAGFVKQTQSINITYIFLGKRYNLPSQPLVHDDLL